MPAAGSATFDWFERFDERNGEWLDVRERFGVDSCTTRACMMKLSGSSCLLVCCPASHDRLLFHHVCSSRIHTGRCKLVVQILSYLERCEEWSSILIGGRRALWPERLLHAISLNAVTAENRRQSSSTGRTHTTENPFKYHSHLQTRKPFCLPTLPSVIPFENDTIACQL